MEPTRRTGRIVALALAGALLLAACDGGEPAATDTPEAPAETPAATPEPPPETEDPGDGVADADEPEEPAAGDEGGAPDTPAVEGPAAPDFTLALADGGEFVLSEAGRPTYLIFWAEW